MAENPNPQPAFIRAGGILGNPVKLTNQVCTRDSPGNIPIVIYDNGADYASGNGAIIENIIIVPTGNVVKSILFVFYKDLSNATPEWLLYDEIDLAAISSISASTKDTNYPLKAPTVRQLYRSMPNVGSTQYPTGYRINGNTRTIQLGVALGTTIGTAPIIVYLEGGEL
jgi:hypothetical protein